MANNKLILRSVISPWVSPFNDITTGSVLSWADVDNNFIYLKGELIHSGYTSGNQLVLQKINGNTITINGIGGGSDSYITGGTYNPTNGIATFTNNTGGTFDVSGFLTGYTNYYTTGVTLVDETLVFDRTDTLSAYTVDLSSIIRNDGNRWYIPSDVVVEIPSDYQSFIYGDLYVQGLIKLNDNSQLVVLNGDIILSGGSISGNGTTLSVELPKFDTKTVSGTYSDGTLTLTNNTGGTVSIDGFYTGSTEVFVTGGTFNELNKILTLNNNTGGTITIDGFNSLYGNYWHIPSGEVIEIEENHQSFIYGDLYIEGLLKLNDNAQLVVLNGDIILSGGSISGNGTTLCVDLPKFDTKTVNGTYTNGLLTLTNNSGGTVSINGFNSLYGNYWYIPSGEVFEIDENHQSFIYGDLYIQGLLKLNDDSQLVVLNGDIILSGGSISGNGTTLCVDLPKFDTKTVSGSYSNGTLTLTNNTGGTVSINGFYTGSTEVFVTGGTFNNINKTLILTNNTGGTVSISGFSDVYTTGGTYNNGFTTFTNNTGGTFVVSSTTTYSAGVISGATGWTSTGTGQINLPALKVALFNNSDNIEPIMVYNVSAGVSGSGGINPLVDNDTNYIVINYNNGNPIYEVLNNDGTVNDSDIVLYLVVYRLNNFIHVLEFGNYGAGLPNKLNDRLMMTDRFARESGLSLGLSGSTGVVLLSSGVAWNGPYRQQLTAVNSQDDIFFKNYHSGGTWTYTTTGNTLNNTYYDDGNDVVSATTGNYIVNYYYRGQEINDHLYEVYGNNEYLSILEAESASEPTLPELITSHAFLVGRIIVKVGELTGITQTSFGTVFQPSGYASGFHNDLLNIQGGAPGEYYHLSSTEYNNLPLSVTGTTLSNNMLYFDRVNSLSAYTVDLSALDFTGNTSASCITDLYISNLYGCSPITLHNSLQSIGSTASGQFSHAEGGNTTANGDYSHAEGIFTTAFGLYSHAEGNQTTASGGASHAEGDNTKALGTYSHAEGDSTSAIGNYSHAEGGVTIASGEASHAEGSYTSASNTSAHAEGSYTIAIGNSSHAEGNNTTANGASSHAEGSQTTANGDMSHAEGSGTKAIGYVSHAEGFYTSASGDLSHAEGGATLASGTYSHAEGQSTKAIGNYGAHAEGANTTASGQASHAEGSNTTASGTTSHSEGRSTTAQGNSSHAEGFGTRASGSASHAEGSGTTASNKSAHAEGSYTIASGQASHAEGDNTTASGQWSHSEGVYTTAIGIASHAEGFYTTAIGTNSHAGGNNSRANGNASFIHSISSRVDGDRSVVLGGQGIIGTYNDTVYVPNLNIATTPSSDNTLTNILVRASDGSVKYRDVSTISSNSRVFQDINIANTYNGDILKVGNGTTEAGYVYYLKSDNTWAKTNASDILKSTGLIGIAIGTNPSTNGMLINGFANNTFLTGTAGQPLYLTTTDGLISEYPPSGVGYIVRVVGYKLANTNSIMFNVDPTFIQLT